MVLISPTLRIWEEMLELCYVISRSYFSILSSSSSDFSFELTMNRAKSAQYSSFLLSVYFDSLSLSTSALAPAGMLEN
jgi:hypothetical protein